MRFAYLMTRLGIVSRFVVLGCSPRPEVLDSQTILINGKIALVDDAFTLVEALAIRDGIVAAVGTTNELRALRGAGTRVIDLKTRSTFTMGRAFFKDPRER